MELFLVIIGVLIFFALIFVFLFKRKKAVKVAPLLLPAEVDVLNNHVEFYKDLPAGRKKNFEGRVSHFLQKIQISGVNTDVTTTDRVLIAASAIIPIFNFDGWEYLNLSEVLLYPDSFSKDFQQAGEERNIGGMVGTGALNRVMILSKPQLQDGFLNKTGKNNTAIHEFVHLVDKTDGTIDGMPEFILQRQYLVPWLKLMQDEIECIRKNESDINPYAATNEAEFLAVVSEYFFERPDLLQEKHPELYEMLSKIFRHPS